MCTQKSTNIAQILWSMHSYDVMKTTARLDRYSLDSQCVRHVTQTARSCNNGRTD